MASPGAVVRPACLILPILVVLLPLLPPETRGESMAGTAALIALLALLVRPAEGDAPRALLLGLALSAASATFLYPASAAGPLVVAILAAAVGIHSAALPSAFLTGPVVPAALAGAGAWVSLHAVVQKIWGLRVLAEQVRSSHGVPDRDAILSRLAEGRAFANFPTPAALGGFLGIALPVTLGLAFRSGRRARIFVLAAGVLEVAGILCAASATAAVALLFALALAGMSRKVSRGLLVAGAAALVVVVVSIAMLRGGEVLDRDHPGSPWALRAGNFRAAWAMAVDHPWTGVGPGGFGTALPRYLREGDNETRYAHDLPLQLAAETGLPAAGVLSILFFALFVGPVLSRRGPPGPPWVNGARVGLAAFAVQNLADFTAFLPSLLWLAAALRGTLSSVEAKEPIPTPSIGGTIRWPLL